MRPPQRPETTMDEPTTAPPDEIQPFLEKAKETIKHCLEEPEIDQFLRDHIKTLRHEWNDWSDSAKHTYTHMMTAQLLLRKAAATQIGIGNEFKLPEPSAQAQLMASIQQTQVKPARRQPALSMRTHPTATSSPQ